MTSLHTSEKAITFRQPTTANLFVDSTDRYDLSGNNTNGSTPFNFQISRVNSIMNGFFTSIGVTELQLNWDVPNISSDASSNLILLDVSGSAIQKIRFSNQYVNTAAAFYDGLVKSVNDLSGTTNFFLTTVGSGTTTPIALTTAGNYDLSFKIQGNVKGGGTNGGFFRFGYTVLAKQASIITTAYTKYVQPTNPDFRLYRFIDFVCPQLIANQRLKDATTNFFVEPVLQRWYFADESTDELDKYNFPILQGYTPFCVRRAYNPPKQIRYESNIPIGNLRFQVYGELWARSVSGFGTSAQIVFPYQLINLSGYNTNYLITLQVSED
jgi:hypothetical protein